MLIPPTRGNLYLHSVQQPGQYKSREPNAGTSHLRFTISLCKSDHFQDLQENCSQSYCLQCFTDPAGCLQTRLHDYKGSKRQRSLPQVSFCYFKIIINFFLMSQCANLFSFLYFFLKDFDFCTYFFAFLLQGLSICLNSGVKLTPFRQM